jgi:glycosyltransferase involved in cell wall biosynthesis
MRVAFYAPLKPPDHLIPSGDRRVAQLFLSALQLAGHDVFLASRFRSYEGRGDPVRQTRLAAIGARLADRFLAHYREMSEMAPELWFTYHLYHKAPDWLGPPIAERLNIPYVVAEASDAPKQGLGAWAASHAAVQRAIQRADAVIGLNPADRDCILPLLRDPRRWIAVKPFLDTACFGRRAPRSGPPRLITVAMMRYGDKLASYQVLGKVLPHLLDLSWSLEIIGDGSARREVEAALGGLGRRVTWSGALEPDAIRCQLASADLFVWPAVNEAFGMALLEAQASGLPVVASSFGGVGEVVVSGVTGLLVPPFDVPAFAEAVRSLISDPVKRGTLAEAAQRRVRAEHSLPAAAHRLAAAIDTIQRARST